MWLAEKLDWKGLIQRRRGVQKWRNQGQSQRNYGGSTAWVCWPWKGHNLKYSHQEIFSIPSGKEWEVSMTCSIQDHPSCSCCLEGVESWSPPWRSSCPGVQYDIPPRTLGFSQWNHDHGLYQKVGNWVSPPSHMRREDGRVLSRWWKPPNKDKWF